MCVVGVCEFCVRMVCLFECVLCVCVFVWFVVCVFFSLYVCMCFLECASLICFRV